MFTDPCAASEPLASKGQLKKFEASELDLKKRKIEN